MNKRPGRFACDASSRVINRRASKYFYLSMLRSKVIRLTAKRRVATALARRISTVGNGPAEEMDVVIIGGGPAGLALATALGILHPLLPRHRTDVYQAHRRLSEILYG